MLWFVTLRNECLFKFPILETLLFLFHVCIDLDCFVCVNVAVVSSDVLLHIQKH